MVYAVTLTVALLFCLSTMTTISKGEMTLLELPNPETLMQILGSKVHDVLLRQREYETDFEFFPILLQLNPDLLTKNPGALEVFEKLFENQETHQAYLSLFERHPVLVENYVQIFEKFPLLTKENKVLHGLYEYLRLKHPAAFKQRVSVSGIKGQHLIL